MIRARLTPNRPRRSFQRLRGIFCTEVGGKALTTDAIKRADLSGDGNEDYILDVGSVHCDGAASVYGDREKGVMVFVGDGKGSAKQAFNDVAYGMKIEVSGPAAKLWLTVSGALLPELMRGGSRRLH